MTEQSKIPAKEEIALITGASSGIGYALLILLLEQGYRVVGTARSASMQRFAALGLCENERLLLLPLDVTSAEERVRVIDTIRARWGDVDILVNNAGISYRAVLEHVTEADALNQLRTNFLAPMELARLVLPAMRKKRAGRIINISSVGGMMAMPTMGSYSASKFALEGASESLWYELRPWGISVVLVQPGFVHSNAFKHVYWTEEGKAALQQKGDYLAYYDEMGKFIERLMKFTRATPASVARKVIHAIESRDPPLRLAATADAVFFGILRRFLPRRFYHSLLYRSLPGVKHWAP
jgi:short-subunit dehydrogenase